MCIKDRIIKLYYYVRIYFPAEKASFFYKSFFLLFNSKITIIIRFPLLIISKLLGSYSPVKLRNVPTKNKTAIFFISFVVVFILSYIVIFVWANLIGVYDGHNDWFYYFSEDISNHINYIILVPLFVSLGILFFVEASQSFHKYEEIAKEGQQNTFNELRPLNKRVGIAIIIFLIGTPLIINYISTLQNKEIYEKTFWMFDPKIFLYRVTTSLTYYYFLLNGLLIYLFVAFASIFVGYFLITLSAIDRILKKYENIDDGISISQIKQIFSTFCRASVFAKATASVLMLNMFTWQAQEYEKIEFNSVLLIVLLLIFGVFITTLPRYWLELRLYDIDLKKKLQNYVEEDFWRISSRWTLLKMVVLTEKVNYNDLRSKLLRQISLILDNTIIFLFTTVYVSL